MIWIERRLRPVKWISKKTWESLKKKERVYLIHKYWNKLYSKQDFMDLLYFDDNSSYWYFLKRLNKKLWPDVEKFNKMV